MSRWGPSIQRMRLNTTWSEEMSKPEIMSDLAVSKVEGSHARKLMMAIFALVVAPELSHLS